MAEGGHSQALWYTLEVLARAARYNRWVMSHFRPYLGRRVLEVGCGIGNFIPHLLAADLVVALDVLPEAVQRVRERWAHLPHVHPILGDITASSTLEVLARAGAPFDTVLFLNVLEHISRDDLALHHAHRLMSAGGHLLLYVPARPGLFGSLDAALGHCRRYSRPMLTTLVREAGFVPLLCHPVNVLGVAAWWFDVRVRRYSRLPLWQIRVFDALVPILRPVETVLRSVWPSMPGLSLVCVARKPDPSHPAGKRP